MNTKEKTGLQNLYLNRYMKNIYLGKQNSINENYLLIKKDTKINKKLTKEDYYKIVENEQKKSK